MSGPKRTRLVDVAAKAGVSPGTASDALAGKNRIPDETRDRIKAIARDLGYTPNPLGKALQLGRLPLIGLLISALDRKAEFDAYRSYWADVLSAVTLSASERGYALVLLSSLDTAELRSIPFAGIIVVDTVKDDPDLIDALELGIPVATDYVQQDSRIAIRFRAEYADSVPMSLDSLRDSGATKFAILMPSVDEAIWIQHVEEAADEWAKQNQESVKTIHLAVDGSETLKALEQIISDGVDGIYSLMPTDEFMIDFKRVCEVDRLTIPRNIHLVMLDEDRTGELHNLGVTIVGISAAEYSNSIVNSLVDFIEDEKSHRMIDIKFNLVEP
jgi:DNA-binding LacI/PurR family transcriptional regulator